MIYVFFFIFTIYITLRREKIFEISEFLFILTVTEIIESFFILGSKSHLEIPIYQFIFWQTFYAVTSYKNLYPHIHVYFGFTCVQNIIGISI